MKFWLGSAVFLFFCHLQPKVGAAQEDIFEVALSLGCDKFVQFMNTSLSIPESIVDNGTYTLFAIRDSDFSTSMIRLLEYITPARRGRYMSYFIVNGTYFLSDFENDKLIDTATIWPYSVRQLRMNVYNNDGNEVYTINGRAFVTNATDQIASNGVVHLIDGFLLHDTYSSAGLIERYPYYSDLQDALAKVNLLDIISGYGPFTIFAPINTAFAELNETRILDYNYPLKGILQGHIVEGTYFSDGLFDGDNLTTLGVDRTIRIGVNLFGRITLNDGQASVLNERNVNNGVIYTINGILTVETDLKENTIMDVAQDLGCDIMLDYLFESRIYDKLRRDIEDGATLFAVEDVGFSDEVRHRLDDLYWQVLQNFMIYHVADGQYTTDTMGNDQIIQTYEEFPRNMRLNFYGGELDRIHTVNGRSLTRSNHVASNGVVHTVDRFVYSASWASCGRYIEASPQLTELEEALDSVGLLDPLFRDDPYTIFAPENGWYDNLNVSDDVLKDILQGHMVNSTYYTEGLLHDVQILTANNKIITVTVDPSTGDLTLTGDRSTTIAGERTVQNGVLHLIDGLIFTETGESTTTVPTTTDDTGGGSSTTVPTTTDDTGGGSSTTISTTTENFGNGSTTTDPSTNKSSHFMQFNALFFTLVTVIVAIKIF